MIPHSLRLRMMGLAIAWVVASLFAAGLTLQYLFGVNIERSTRQDMDAALTRLAAVIVPATGIPSAPLPDPRYATPFGGRYWQIQTLDTGEIVRSRSLWDFVLEARNNNDSTYGANGPDARKLILLTRQLSIDSASGSKAFLVTVGQDQGPIQEATDQFGRDAAQVLILLGALIVLASWLQIRLGLAPILGVKRAIEAVRRGDVARLDGNFPTELGPLVQEVNELLATREVMMDRARARAADLAHGLKTPLAAVHGIAERLRDKGNAAEADLLQDISIEMSERVDYQMRLAALRVRTSAHSTRSSLNTALLRTLAVLKKTGRGENIYWAAELSEDCWVDIHRQDLMELVGVTLENAAKWATSRVIIRCRRNGDKAILEISDDGPGIAPDQMQSIGTRGLRLDQTRPGSGLGLAIAIEIIDINQGTIAFGQSETGGLVVTIVLALAHSTAAVSG